MVDPVPWIPQFSAVWNMHETCVCCKSTCLFFVISVFIFFFLLPFPIGGSGCLLSEVRQNACQCQPHHSDHLRVNPCEWEKVFVMLFLLLLFYHLFDTFKFRFQLIGMSLRYFVVVICDSHMRNCLFTISQKISVLRTMFHCMKGSQIVSNIFIIMSNKTDVP